MTTDEKYMHRAIQLAKCGEASVAPNPMVGAVIVCQGKIIGEGFHRQYGGPHAEVNAINGVKLDGKSLANFRDDEEVLKELRHLMSEATMYVTLEPCSHWGKTPPCCELIIEVGIKRVVVGMLDPNAKVNGEGIRRMREAGIDVVTGVLEKECWAINPRFNTFHSQRRPWITLKWAQLSDGTIGCKTKSDSRLHISTSFTSMLVHRLRARCQAIMVGTNTAINDRPSLTTRLWQGASPLRVTIDRKGVLSNDFTQSEVETVVYHNEILSEILYDLHKRGVQHLMVEGGSKLLQSFIDAGLWDEARIEISPQTIAESVGEEWKERVVAPVLKGAELYEEYYVDGHKMLKNLKSAHF